jgi:hypothetical protein
MTAEIRVSGAIAPGATTRTITYYVVDRASGSVVGNLLLPDAATFANRFDMKVTVPRVADTYDVGTFDDAGEFVSANFALSIPGAIGGS